MFAFSHFRVSACILTAVLPGGNAVAFSLRFYRVKTPSHFHCSFTEWGCHSVSTAVSPSENAVVFPLQFYRVKTPLCFHCSFTEWKRPCFFTAVLPSENAVAFSLGQTAVNGRGESCIFSQKNKGNEENTSKIHYFQEAVLVPVFELFVIQMRKLGCRYWFLVANFFPRQNLQKTYFFTAKCKA